MGTSNSFGGGNNSNPLIPSWLPSGGDAFPAGPGPGPGPGANPAPGGPPGGGPNDGGPKPNLGRNPNPPIPPSGGDRYAGARTDFSKFAGSGGTNTRALGRSISNYVSTVSGGKRTAARRMGSSQIAGSRMLGFMADARATSVREALRTLNLEHLAGLPVDQIFLGLIEHVCPPGGTVDEGIARDAFVETIAEMADLGITDLDKLTVDQMQGVLEAFATHSIEARLYNDIGTKVISLPADPGAVEKIQTQVRDFIRRGVSDALTQAHATLVKVTTYAKIPDFINAVYEAAFEILQALGDTEANS